MRKSTIITAAIIATIAACKQEDAKHETAGATHGMMQNMNDSSMMQMDAHMSAMMNMMQHASGDSLKAMLPQHRQMAGNTIAKFNQDMASMNMKPDTSWNALVDSLRYDLTSMPNKSSNDLKSMMPAHMARMQRLVQMHKGMM